MTRNVFLGADLSPAIEAPGIPQAIDGAGTVWNELQSTKFAERVIPLAREIKASKADLVGLQEVALWRKQTPSDGGAPPISPMPGRDRGDRRRAWTSSRCCARSSARATSVVVVQEEFDAELPVDADANDATGTGPLAGSGADFDARLTMRDVILVRKGSKVKLGKTRTGHFKTRYEPNVGGIKIPVDRGWASVEARVGKKKFRFVNTHLEAFGDTKIREAQAKELTKGPLKAKGQVVLVGDLNSGIKRHNEPEKPGDDLAFRALAKFGHEGQRRASRAAATRSLFDPAALLRPHGRPRAEQAGAEDGARDASPARTRGERTPSGLWPSDHGGVDQPPALRG